jgi:hypothetical protein
MGAVTREAVSNLEALIEQKHARVEIGELPVLLSTLIRSEIPD